MLPEVLTGSQLCLKAPEKKSIVLMIMIKIKQQTLLIKIRVGGCDIKNFCHRYPISGQKIFGTQACKPILD
jgi:hypothetical protein